jgi:hypothetical protein
MGEFIINRLNIFFYKLMGTSDGEDEYAWEKCIELLSVHKSTKKITIIERNRIMIKFSLNLWQQLKQVIDIDNNKRDIFFESKRVFCAFSFALQMYSFNNLYNIFLLDLSVAIVP